MKEPGRTPPKDVLTALRREVRFHCPVEVDGTVCGSPYLTWHHFDPPWRKEKHHRVEGMIALCRSHADKADNGSYTDDQLRRFKAKAAANYDAVQGDFAWMRQQLVMYAGTNLFIGTDILVEIGDTPLVWFTVNEHGERMLNYRNLHENSTVIEDNVWTIGQDELSEVICPPGARTLDVTHSNGDHLRVEYHSFDTPQDVVAKFPKQAHNEGNLARLTFPLTIVELTDETSDGLIKIRPENIDMAGHIMTGSWLENNGRGIMINPPEE